LTGTENIKTNNPLVKVGTEPGQLMPATDYWYSIELQDGRVFSGHFALKGN
jgi:gliding motility-associated-like protein